MKISPLIKTVLLKGLRVLFDRKPSVSQEHDMMAKDFSAIPGEDIYSAAIHCMPPQC